MKDKTKRTIVLLVGSLAGAILLSIAVAAVTYFILQYATENQVQARKATIASVIKTREALAANLIQTAAGVETEPNALQKLPVESAVVVPTAVPAPGPASTGRIVPDGWIDYQIVEPGVTFAYPPHWGRAEEDTNSVTFSPDINQTVLVVAAKDGSFVQVMADGSTEMLKRGVLTFTPEDVDVTFHDEGIVAAPYRPAYLTARLYEDGDPVSLLITYATNGKQTLLILLLRNGLPDDSATDFAIATQLVQSVSFDGHRSGPNVAQESLNLLLTPIALPTAEESKAPSNNLKPADTTVPAPAP